MIAPRLRRCQTGLAMLDFSIQVRSDAVADLLDRLHRGMDDLQPVMDGIGQELESRISGRFETETDPMGQPWEPWAPSTRESYPDDGNGRILDRLGDMLDSLTHTPDTNSVRVGFGDPKAAYHEWGTWKMARRGMLFSDPDAGELGPDDEAAILDILDVWLQDLIG